MGEKTAYFGVFAALAIIFGYIEVIFPFHVGIQGVKLGIANLVIVIVLYKMGNRASVAISVIRIIVSGFLFSNAFSILYSLAGSILSLIVMAFLKKKSWFSVYGVSVAGGVMHNMGQLIMAAIVTQTVNIFYYIPVLLAAGAIAGLVIGILSSEMLRHLESVDMTMKAKNGTHKGGTR